MVHKTIISMPKLLWGGILLFVDIMANPSFRLFFIVLAGIVLDFATGIAKAKMNKKARTSEGYQKTVTKVMQYITPILILWAASKYIPEYGKQLKEISGWLMMFVIYVEVTSIFENLYEMDSRSTIAKYLYKPALKILKFGIENNPVNKKAENIDKKEVSNEKPD